MSIYLPPDDASILPDQDDLAADPDDDTTAYYGSEYSFDFDTGDLATEVGGEVSLVSGPDAVAQSLTKALTTQRFAHLAYTADYGNEAHEALANPPVGTTLADVALSYCAEVIQNDPRVAGVDSLDTVVNTGAETVQVTCTVIDTFGSIIDLDVTFSYA